MMNDSLHGSGTAQTRSPGHINAILQGTSTLSRAAYLHLLVRFDAGITAGKAFTVITDMTQTMAQLGRIAHIQQPLTKQLPIG